MFDFLDSSEEELNDVDVEDEDDEEFPFDDESADEDFVGRSSEFRWSAKEPAMSNLVVFDDSKTGFQTDFSKIKTPKDAFLQFLDESIIKMVCEFTNAEAKSREPDFRPIDMVEFLGWISLLVRAGESHQNRTHINVLWTSDSVYEQPFFQTVMSRTRYQQIFKFLR